MAAAPSFDVDGFYRRYGPMVLRRCLRLLRNEAEAADCMQEVFVQVLRHRERLASTSVVGLLQRIATNVALNRIRSRRTPVDASEAVLLTIAHDGDLEHRTSVRRLVDRLFREEHERTRVMAVLHFVDGLSHEEVGREFGISAEGARKALQQFRGRISSCLEEA